MDGPNLTGCVSALEWIKLELDNRFLSAVQELSVKIVRCGRLDTHTGQWVEPGNPNISLLRDLLSLIVREYFPNKRYKWGGSVNEADLLQRKFFAAASQEARVACNRSNGHVTYSKPVDGAVMERIQREILFISPSAPTVRPLFSHTTSDDEQRRRRGDLDMLPPLGDHRVPT
jgi:hypothetical protein